MAFDAFLDIATVKGESTADGMKDKIEILSFSFGASNPSTANSAKGGLAAGKVSISSFNVMKKLDLSSAPLMQACCKGDHFATAKVTLRKAGGNAGQVAFLVYEFNHVMVDSIQWSGSSGGDDTPTESVAFAFADYKSTYSKADTGGKVTKQDPVGWSVVENKKV